MLEEEIFFINRFLKHTRLVQDNAILLENNLKKLNISLKDFDLFYRTLSHDIDKLQNDLINIYIKISQYYNNIKNGFSTDGIDIDFLKKHIEKHYSSQRHHFYRNEIEPSIIDICEMCCDIDAISIEQQEENNRIYFENYMLLHYPKLLKYKDLIFKIFYILENKDKTLYNKKSIFLDKLTTYIRKVQNNRLIIEKNANKLNSPFDKWDFFREGIFNDITNIKNNLNNNFTKSYQVIINNKTTNNIYELCSKYCANAYFNGNNNYFLYLSERVKVDNQEEVKIICDLIQNNN